MKVLLLILALSITTTYSYTIHSRYAGTTFFNAWNFFTGGDPTHGTVNYVDQATAQADGYIGVRGDAVYIGSDTKNKATGRGRNSVLISTKEVFNNGLFVMDLTHMPTGCGTWPAWWTVGPNWPTEGEIDIIEGVNKQSTDQSTLHTNAGCVMTHDNVSMTGRWVSRNCLGNNGCGIQAAANSYGAPFNSAGGGVFVAEWTPTFIRMFYFPRNKIPDDVNGNSPNPDSWGLPYAYFALGSECPASHFKDHVIIINLTFCGDWAGQVFANQCPGMGSCADYVKNNPQAFAEAYWLINYVAVFK